MIFVVYEFPSKILLMLCMINLVDTDCIFQSKKFSYDRSSVRPVTKLCPYQMVSAFFYRIFSFSKSFCKMIWLADKISILIYLRYNFLRTYTDLSSIYYFIIKFCHFSASCFSFFLVDRCFKFICGWNLICPEIFL